MIRYLLPILLFAFPAIAQDATEDTASTYAPSRCEFTVTFPDEPYSVRRCDKEKKDQCYELVSYTQVYGLDATVNFRVICNPISKEVTSAYDEEVMGATLRAMTKSQNITTHNSAFREGNGYKQAGLVGEGKSGQMPMVYIAQLWIGERSAFSVEAELIGDARGEADKLFGDVLRSIGHKAEVKVRSKPAAPKAKEAVAPAEEK